MKIISSKGVTVMERKKRKRTKTTIFREEIFKLPAPLRFLKRVAVQNFQLPDGSEGQWESIYSKAHTVLIAALTLAGKLILVEMFRFPVHGDCLELPGGDAGDGENLEVAARRELLEETGYTTKKSLINLGGGHLCSSGTNGGYTVFAAFNCRKTHEPNLDAVEKAAGLRVVKKSPREIWGAIARGDQNIDPQLAFAILALHARGIIAL